MFNYLGRKADKDYVIDDRLLKGTRTLHGSILACKAITVKGTVDFVINLLSLWGSISWMAMQHSRVWRNESIFSTISLN